VSGPSALPQQYAATPYQHQMQYNPQADLGQSDLASAYSALDSEISPGLGAEVAGQEEQDDVGLIRDQYQKLLRETNEKAYRGQLIEGAESLLQMSELLLGRCEALGMLNIACALNRVDVSRSSQGCSGVARRKAQALEGL